MTPDEIAGASLASLNRSERYLSTRSSRSDGGVDFVEATRRGLAPDRFGIPFCPRSFAILFLTKVVGFTCPRRRTGSSKRNWPASSLFLSQNAPAASSTIFLCQICRPRVSSTRLIVRLLFALFLAHSLSLFDCFHLTLLSHILSPGNSSNFTTGRQSVSHGDLPRSHSLVQRSFTPARAKTSC